MEENLTHLHHLFLTAPPPPHPHLVTPPFSVLPLDIGNFKWHIKASLLVPSTFHSYFLLLLFHSPTCDSYTCNVYIIKTHNVYILLGTIVKSSWFVWVKVKNWKTENNVTFLASIQMDSPLHIPSTSQNHTSGELALYLDNAFLVHFCYYCLPEVSDSLLLFLIFCNIIKASWFSKFSTYSLTYKLHCPPLGQDLFHSISCLSSPIGTSFSLDLRPSCQDGIFVCCFFWVGGFVSHSFLFFLFTPLISFSETHSLMCMVIVFLSPWKNDLYSDLKLDW